MPRSQARLVTVWETTPSELRRIAEYLETRWAHATAGQEVPKYDTYQGVIVTIDQVAMHDEERERRNTVTKGGA